MVVELFCFIAVIVVLKYFFYDDDVIDVGSSDFNALFTVAERYYSLFELLIFNLLIDDFDFFIV